MMHAPSSAHLQDLAALGDHLLDRELVLRGAFKDEIERIRKVNAELKDRQGVVKTIEDADGVRAEADRYAEGVRAALHEAEKKAALTESRVASKLATLKAREEAADEIEAKAIIREEAAARREKEAAGAFDSERASIERKEAQLQATEKSLKERESVVARREARLKAIQEATA